MMARRFRVAPGRVVRKYLHYGDANHRPMQTVSFYGTMAELHSLIREARNEKWPLKVSPFTKKRRRTRR